MENKRVYHSSSAALPGPFTGKVPSITENLSHAGMVCRTPHQLEELTLVAVSFALPSVSDAARAKEWVECEGVVVHCEKKESEGDDLPYEVAIFFASISEKHRLLLSDYLHKCRAVFHKPVCGV